MKILLVADNQDVKELLTFQITSRFQAKVKECLSARDAVDALKKSPEEFDLIVGPFHGPNSVLVKFLRETKSILPVLFFFDPLVVKPDKDSFLGITVVGSVDHTKLVDGVLLAIQDFQKSGVEGLGDLQEFCPIRTNLLIKVSPLKSDIYIRLNQEKFLKLLRTGDEFNAQDLERYYEEKKVEYLYLRREETSEFIDKFRKELDELLSRKDVNQEEMIAASEMAHDAVLELVQRIGFDEAVQELAKKNVSLTLKAIGSNPRLSDLVRKFALEGNYLSQHSTLLAHVACCVAKELEWGSEATFSKLVIASFMHDITLKNSELAKINSLRELEEKKTKFSEVEVSEYHLHPAKSADLVRSFKDIPADVDLIVQQHHERPNGGGFPRGLLHNYIAPLSSVFILAHELTQAILAQRGSFSLQDFLQEKKPFFNQGNFKKVIAALQKVKL